MELLLFCLITGTLLAIVAGKLDPDIPLGKQAAIVVLWPPVLLIMAIFGTKLRGGRDGNG